MKLVMVLTWAISMLEGHGPRHGGNNLLICWNCLTLLFSGPSAEPVGEDSGGQNQGSLLSKPLDGHQVREHEENPSASYDRGSRERNIQGIQSVYLSGQENWGTKYLSHLEVEPNKCTSL